eukprot:646734-Pleurochrysis_carterae.AAC.1
MTASETTMMFTMNDAARASPCDGERIAALASLLLVGGPGGEGGADGAEAASRSAPRSRLVALGPAAQSGGGAAGGAFFRVSTVSSASASATACSVVRCG